MFFKKLSSVCLVDHISISKKYRLIDFTIYICTYTHTYILVHVWQYNNQMNKKYGMLVANKYIYTVPLKDFSMNSYPSNISEQT